MAQKNQSPEFSKSIFVKFIGHSVLYFKLFIYLLEIKRLKCFRGFTPLPWTPTNRAPPSTCYRVYVQHLQTPTCILLNLCSKMDIRVSHFQDYIVKRNWIWSLPKMNLIHMMLWLASWQLIVFKSPDRYISSGKVVLTNIKSVSKYGQVG